MYVIKQANKVISVLKIHLSIE